MFIIRKLPINFKFSFELDQRVVADKKKNMFKTFTYVRFCIFCKGGNTTVNTANKQIHIFLRDFILKCLNPQFDETGALLYAKIRNVRTNKK